jgi:hypothetical protein
MQEIGQQFRVVRIPELHLKRTAREHIVAVVHARILPFSSATRNAGAQLIYVLLYFILLTYCERNCWSVDRWWETHRR